MIWYRIFQSQMTEPAIRQIQMDFLAQPPLGADAEAVAYDQHPDHELGINRRPAGVAIESREVLAQFAQIEKTINAAQQMALGDVIFEIEGVEQRFLAV